MTTQPDPYAALPTLRKMAQRVTGVPGAVTVMRHSAVPVGDGQWGKRGR